MKRATTLARIGWLAVTAAALAAEKDEKGWISLFDGKSFNGWKANENPDTWKVEDGALVCHGPRSHLFYMGDKEPFVNFHLKADVMTSPGSNSGIYIHTKYQESGWPSRGYEVQVNITHGDPKKSGGLYGVVDVRKPPAKDNEWYTQEIIVRGKQIISKINGKTVVDYTEPAGRKPATAGFDRRLDEGTFALQGHDPGSTAHFFNFRC